MSDKVTPRIDLAFKKIFGVEGNEDLLISLVNAVLSPEDQVSSIKLLNPYNLQSFRKDKLSVLDLKAQSIDGRRFNIEIQITDEANYDKRALYYWAKLYTEQLESGHKYENLYKAIGIHILNFTSIHESNRYHNVFHIREKTEDFTYFTDLELHTVELKKFQEGCEELSELVSKVKNALDMWVAFLTKHNLLDKDHLPPSLDNPALKKALGVLEVLNFTKEEREAYEDRLKWFMIEADTLKKYSAESFKQGKEEGREEGRHERNLEIACMMLSRHLDISLIAQTTGLSEEEIAQLLCRT